MSRPLNSHLVLVKWMAFEGFFFFFPFVTSINKINICDWGSEDGVLGPWQLNVAHLQIETSEFTLGQRQEPALGVS